MAASYTIIGLDGKEYGPVPVEGLIEWVTKGAVNAATMVTEVDSGQAIAAGRMPELAEVLTNMAAYANAPAPAAVSTPSSGSALIPTGNPQALTGYYVSVGSLIPCVGLILGPLAIVLGSKGLKSYNENPAVKGKAHALVAIILGSLTALANLVGIVAILLSAKP